MVGGGPVLKVTEFLTGALKRAPDNSHQGGLHVIGQLNQLLGKLKVGDKLNEPIAGLFVFGLELLGGFCGHGYFSFLASVARRMMFWQC